MELSKIVAISGRGGLFRIVSQAKNSVIVESLSDVKRFPVFSHEKVSSLEEIRIYTTGEERSLTSIFKDLHQKLEGKEAPDPKTEDANIRTFFREVIPDYDQERVYLSDIRKILSWYNQLLAKELLDFTEPQETVKEEAPPAESETVPTVEKPAEKKTKPSAKGAKSRKK